MIDERAGKAPFLRALIPLLGGIILAGYRVLPLTAAWLLCVAFTLLLFAACLLCRVFIRPRTSRLYGIVFHLQFFSLGMLAGTEKGSEDIPAATYTARIIGDVTEMENSYRLVLDRICYCTDSPGNSLKGRAQVYVRKDRRCGDLRPGMFITARGGLAGYDPSGRKKGFDYDAYLAGRGILYTGYLDSLSWTVVRGYAETGIRIRARNIRRSMLGMLDAGPAGGKDDNGQVLASLLLGYRAGLEDSLEQDYARSGTIHVLAISGLHVGILYLLPAMLIGRMRRSLPLRIIFSVLAMAGLWTYAIITGLSPSVTRAAGMCCIHAIAGLAGRKTGIMHVLSLAAFIMVVCRPQVIFEAGFQLSFSAVAGIALFYRRITDLLTVRGWFLNRLWRMAAVSLAAQAGTAPLVVYHFHQYPSYSVFSNLVAVPLVTLILYTGVLFFSLSPVPAVSGILLAVLDRLALVLNRYTGLVSHLPGACPDELSLSVFQVFLMYGIIVLLYVYMEHRKAGWLTGLLALLVLFFLVSCCRKYRRLQYPVSFTGELKNDCNKDKKAKSFGEIPV